MILSHSVSGAEELAHSSKIANAIFVLTPAFEAPDDFADNFYRALWFLAPLLRTGAILVVTTRLEQPIAATPPHYLDPSLAKLANELSSQIHFTTPHVLANVPNVLHGATILVHKEDQLPAIREHYKGLGVSRFIRVDPKLTQYEASLYLRLSSNDGKGTTDQLSVCRTRFERLAESVDTQRVFIFGTGPSLDDIDFDALPLGEKLVTNSMVVNSELLSKIKPKLIVASDPIFHAGCSSYAGEFRANLIKAMREYGAYFIFPMRDYGVYSSHLPEDLREKLIGIPLVQPGPINTDLRQSFWASTTQNVMTLLLLPIATTFSKNVVMAGFDGRPIAESDYYWSHSKTSQLHDRMGEIKEAHPAFFSVDYNDYLFKHMRTVSDYLSDAEERGSRFVSLTDSHVPAVKGRYIRNFSWEHETQPSVSIIMPCRNAGRFLDKAIQSVVQQDYDDWELIIIDDASTDDSPQTSRRWQVADNRIRVESIKHSGVSLARNTGLELARGKYLCFLDADDTLLPGSLKKRVAALEKASPNALIYGRLVVIDEEDRPLNVVAGSGGTVTFDRFDLWPAATNTAMGRASVMKARRFNTRMAYAEDWLYFAELARYGAVLETTGTDIATYRWHPVSATQNNFIPNIVQSSMVFRYLVGDEWTDKLVEPDYAPGADASLMSHIEVKRMHSLLLQCVFSGNKKGAHEIAEIIRAKTKRIPLVSFGVDDVERAAVRVYLKPFNSREIYKYLANDMPVARELLAECGLTDDSAPMFSSFDALEDKARAQLGLANGTSLFKMAVPRTAPNSDQLPFSLTRKQRALRNAYRAVRAIPLVDPLLRPLKEQYLRTNGLT